MKTNNQPNILWRIYFRWCVSRTQKKGNCLMNIGRLSPLQKKWVEARGYIVTEAEQDVPRPEHLIFVGK